ncbi:hypothetical protein EAO75_44975, partial [Streptomyces sp. uw30]|uniref:hypothetical protein n=1 Tax=Streptomyces sp. uw30 TaxID=1828179 RepID=UPI00130AD802
GKRPNEDYDLEVVYLICVLHDMGLTDEGNTDQRFEVEGADLAAALLTKHGVATADVDRVWEAIALHTTPDIAVRRGLLALLTFEGIYIDFGKNADLVAEWAPTIHAVYPRQAMVRSMADAILTHAARSEGAAQRYTFAHTLVRERETDGQTFMESTVINGPWGE